MATFGILGAWSPCPPSLNPPMLTETERGISATDTRHSNARTQCQLSRHVGRNKHTFSDSLTQQNTSDSAVILATCSDDRTTHDVKRNILSRSNAVRALPSQDQTQDFGIFLRRRQKLFINTEFKTTQLNKADIVSAAREKSRRLETETKGPHPRTLS